MMTQQETAAMIAALSPEQKAKLEQVKVLQARMQHDFTSLIKLYFETEPSEIVQIALSGIALYLGSSVLAASTNPPDFTSKFCETLKALVEQRLKARP